MVERMSLESQNPISERVKQLKAIFPEVFTEDKVDIDRFRNILGESVNQDKEKYGLSWAGKSDAIKQIQIPSIGTLKPCEEESIDFDNTENLFIEGDNLEVLKLLQKSYSGMIKMIYIDPPYNTGNDFIYKDDYRNGTKNYLEQTKQVNEEGNLNTTNKETNGRFHSDWLSMMYPRLFLAKNLLKQDGVVFISIDDKEINNLNLICNEIFGEENFVAIMCWKNVTDNNPTLINKDNEFVICYAKSKVTLPESWKSSYSEAKELLSKEFDRLKSSISDIEEIQHNIRQFIKDNLELMGNLSRYKNVDEIGVYTGSESVHNPRAGGYIFDVIHPLTGKKMRNPANGYRFPESTFRDMERKGIIIYGEDEKRIVKIKKYLHEFEDTLRSVIVLDGRLGSYDLKRVFEIDVNLFDNPKPVELISTLLSFATNKEDIVLDLFSGSATTAHAVLKLNKAEQKSNRRFICIQYPEPIEKKKEAFKVGYRKISELSKDRIKKAIQGTQNIAGLGGGFKVFKLSESNFKIWDGTAIDNESALADQMQLFVDEQIRADSTQEDILYELILKAGLDLNVKVEQIEVIGKSVYLISGGKMVIYLDNEINKGIIDKVIELAPKSFICLDTAFSGNDMQKTNTALQLEDANIVFKTV